MVIRTLCQIEIQKIEETYQNMIIVKNEHIGVLVSLCHTPHVHSYIYIQETVL
jgi:hypothetical protein